MEEQKPRVAPKGSYKDYENRLYDLQLKIAQTDDAVTRERLQGVLAETEAAYQQALLVAKRQKRVRLLWGGVALVAVLLVAFLYSQWTATERGRENYQSAKENFGKTTTEATTAAKATTTTEASTQETTEEASVFPSALLGSWYAQESGKNLVVTYDANGRVQIAKEGFETTSAQVHQLEQVGQGIYAFTASEGTPVPFGYGLGGVGVKYQMGVKISGDGQTLSPLVWQARVEDGFDYSSPLPSSQLYLGRTSPGPNIDYGNRGATEVDTKNLTTAQVENWTMASYAQTMTSQPQHYWNLGWTVESWMGNDGLVYATIYDRSGTVVWEYRINANGELEGKGSPAVGKPSAWTVLSRTYFD